MKKIDMKKIGITIGIVLLLIGNVNAEDSVIEDTPNISIGGAMGDTNDSSAIENITLERSGT